MELILRSINQHPDWLTEILHLIIGPVVNTLKIAIDNQNPALQVIILNLLKVILFENEVHFFNVNMGENNPFYHNAIRLFKKEEGKNVRRRHGMKSSLVDCI
jgi:hypothetical protein